MQLIAIRFRKYVENTFWLILEKGFTLVAGVVVGIYVARYLRPESFGLLNYAISFVGIFSVFSTLGLDQIIVRELSRRPSRKNELLGTGFILRVLGSVFLMATMCGALIFMGNDSLTNTLILIVASAEILKGFEVISYLYQSQVESKHAVHIQLAVNLMVSLIKLVMVMLQAPLIAFAIMVAVGSLLNAVGFIWTYEVRTGALRNWVFRKELALDLLKESWPLIFYGLALHTQARIDQVMLGNMLNNHEVGQYSVALKFIEVFGFVPMVLMSSFTPAVSKAKIADEGLYQSRLLNLYRLMFMAFLAVAIPVYFFSERVIMLLYGAEYQPAGYLLSLFALRLFFSNMGVGKSVFVMNENLFKYSLLTVILGAIANIGLNYVLIPQHGPVGSVVASMLSFTVSIFVVDLFFRKTRQNQKLIFKGILSFWKLNNVQ